METVSYTDKPSVDAPNPRRPQHVHIGAAWISLIEPEIGYDHAFNQWYGDDHFYAGGMTLPGIFAGRRSVATKALRQLRLPNTTDALTSDGCFLHLNLMNKEQLNDVSVALGQTLQTLGKIGRMYPSEIPRKHIYSALTPYEGVVYRDQTEQGPLDIHALDYPFAGVVLEIIDAREGCSRQDLLKWLLTQFVPTAIKDTSSMMCLAFRHEDLPNIIRSPRLPLRYEEGPSRVALLWFLESNPLDVWDINFAHHVRSISDSNLGNVKFLGPFIPTVPGTQMHIDQLR